MTRFLRVLNPNTEIIRQNLYEAHEHCISIRRTRLRELVLRRATAFLPNSGRRQDDPPNIEDATFCQ